MKKYLFLLLIASISISAISDSIIFTGQIRYKYSFTDLEGKDITGNKGPVLGFEQYYFVNDSSYKSYDEANNITQLYDGRSNTYYGFWKDKTSLQIDALNKSSQQYIVTRLDKRERILGYDCTAIQVQTDNASTVYYYSPLLRINTQGFRKHNFGDFNEYLQATNGALALKYVITYPKEGYVWTILAQKITKMTLSANDFKFPEGYKLKN